MDWDEKKRVLRRFIFRKLSITDLSEENPNRLLRFLVWDSFWGIYAFAIQMVGSSVKIEVAYCRGKEAFEIYLLVLNEKLPTDLESLLDLSSNWEETIDRIPISGKEAGKFWKLTSDIPWSRKEELDPLRPSGIDCVSVEVEKWENEIVEEFDSTGGRDLKILLPFLHLLCDIASERTTSSSLADQILGLKTYVGNYPQ
jgi:hypothetical protein